MRLTKTIMTETAHRLLGYNGACQNIHGHSYKFEVTLEGFKLDGIGIGIDFKDIKQEACGFIHDMYDHAIVLNSEDPLVQTLKDSGVKITVMDRVNPTAENMAIVIFRALVNKFPGKVYEVKVWETTTSCASIGGV